MNILFLSRRFYPDIGGVEKHVFEISKILIEKGNNVTVLTESEGKEMNLAGMKIIRLPKIEDSWFKKFKIWIWFIKNIEIIKSAEVVHAHDVFYWYLPFKFMFLSKKCFITFHGYENYPIKKRAIIVRKISEKLSDGNIIVGDFIKKWYKTQPNYVIYGGTNIPENTSEAIQKKSAVFIGRLDYHTGILDYAKSIELVREKIPDFKFTIVGDGEELKRLKKFKPLGAKKEVSKYLSSNNYAFVSRYLSILEALAHKRLVFALYDNPVKEDYLRMASFAKYIVIENSAEKLAERVIYFVKNPKYSKKLTENGFIWVKNQTWEKVAMTYINLWK